MNSARKLKKASLLPNFFPIPPRFLFGTLVLLAGCASTHQFPGPESAQAVKEDSLIAFKEFVAAGNFQAAVHHLVPADQAKILNAKGHVPEAMRERLFGVPLKDLIHDPNVRLVNGKLTGIYASLPVEQLGKSLPIDSNFATESEATKTPTEDSLREQKLHAAAEDFFTDIRAGKWQAVLEDMYPSTRLIFLSSNGHIKASARHRLAAIDTTAWNSLTLRRGKLVGVSLIIPQPPPELEAAANAFFDSIAAGNWNAVLNMLVENEQKALTGPDGKIKPEYQEKLSRLNPDDWDALFWYDGKLSGVLDLLGEKVPPIS